MPRQTFQIPKFKTKDDPELWLYRFNKASKMNNWDDDTKLNFVDNSFNYTLQLWFMQQDFKSWEQFKITFLSKYSRKVNLGKIVVELLNFKIKKNESTEDYIARFETKRNLYNREVLKRKQKSNNSSMKLDNKKNDEDNITQEAEFVITDKGFVKHFIKGISSKGLQRYLKSEKPGSLEKAYILLKEMADSDDEDSSSDFDSSSECEESDSSSSSESDSESYKTVVVKSKKRNGEKKIKNDKTNDKADTNKEASIKEDPAVSQLITGISNMSLMLSEFITSAKEQNKSINNNKQKSKCWNCMSEDHKSQSCPKPCKFCQSSTHKHYDCPDHPRNKKDNQNGKQSESMLMEFYLSEKRTAKDMDIEMVDVGKVSKRKTVTPRVTRAAAAAAASSKVKILPITPVVTASTTAVKTPVTKAVAKTKPKHPLLPVENTSKEERRQLKEQKVETIIHQLLNEPVHKVSLNQLADLSPIARSRIRQKLTRSHANTLLLGEEEDAQFVDSRRNSVPKGKGAPRSFGMVNGTPVELILDGGCTSFIISLHFARKIGITEVETCGASVLFGDGVNRPPIGLVRNLKVQVGPSEVISVNALCFDVGERYDFIVGREGLYELGVNTDWSKHYWYIKNEEGEETPFDVHYFNQSEKC